jgi:hypothetical protein
MAETFTAWFQVPGVLSLPVKDLNRLPTSTLKSFNCDFAERSGLSENHQAGKMGGLTVRMSF